MNARCDHAEWIENQGDPLTLEGMIWQCERARHMLACPNMVHDVECWKHALEFWEARLMELEKDMLK